MLARGVSIGRYVVLALVGRGGMGEVYAAYDPELDRKVAIKLLRVRGAQAAGQAGQSTSQDSGRARLMREAQAIAKLSHPNVVVVYDVGTFQDQVFIAMEFVEGHTVGYWIAAQARPWSEVLKVFAAAGRGLAAAHDKNLIHRDFKPDNVMLGSDGHVRVMDFGLARLGSDRSTTERAAAERATAERAATERGATERAATRASVSTEAPEPDPGSTMILDLGLQEATKSIGSAATAKIFTDRLTQTGSMLGTPAYMAPEQFLAHPIDARTDQFSFCVALYEALYGDRPFEGATLFGLTANVIQGKVRPAPAETKVPSWLRKVLLRGFSVAPDKRWPSMNALLAELERNRAVAGRRRFAVGAADKLAGIWEAPVRGRAGESASKATIRQAFLATNKRYAGAAFENVSRILDRYATAWSDMYASACEATHTRGEQSAEVLDLRMAALHEALQVLRALCDAFRGATGQVVENAVDAANSLPSIERCADINLLRAVVKPPEDPAARATVDRLRTELAEVRTLSRVGRLADGVRAMEPLEKEVRSTGYRPLLAEVLLELGTLHTERREPDAAGRAYEEAVWTAELVRHDEVAAEAATQLVGIAAQRSRFEAADIWARHAETILNRLGGRDRLWGWLFNNLGLLRHTQGNLIEAVDDIQRAIAAKEKALGADDPDLGSSIGNLAVCLAELGRLEDAAEHGARAIKIVEAGLGPDHPRTAIHLANHGETLNQLGRFAEARDVSQRALAIFERETEPEGVFVTAALTALGIAQLGEGLLDDALLILERAVRNRQNNEAGAPARLAEVHFALARALWEANVDRPRAATLAALARDQFKQGTPAPATTRALTAIDHWLATHPI